MTNYTFTTASTNTTLSGLVAGDTISFGVGFNPENFSFLQDGDDMIVTTNTGLEIRLVDQLLSDPLIYNMSFVNMEGINLYVDNVVVASSASQNITTTTAMETIYGGTGNNTINGNGGRDIIYAGSGNDSIQANFEDKIFAGQGDDIIWGQGGEEVIHGGEGNDRIWYKDYQDAGGVGMMVDLATEYAQSGGMFGTDIIDVENVTGSVYADTLIGDDNNNELRGGSDRSGLTDGDDTITGNGGDDMLYGNNGNDALYGGNDNDFLYGNNGNDTLNGDNGDDRLNGGTGDDVLKGGDGSDYLYGEAGDDILVGGSGIDFLYGGANDGSVDQFGFTSNEDSYDRIYNFEYGTDIINITDLLTGYIDGLSDINDFVQVNHVGSRFDLRIDADGGADNFANTARVLTNIDNGITAQDMLDNGALVADGSIIV